MAIANPIEGDWVRMTNRDWAFSIQEAQRQLDLSTLLVVNNFTALAMSLPRVGPTAARQVGGGEAQPNGVIGLIGPGTGLGVSGLIPSGDRWVTLATEGGHASFAPTDERELRILQYAWKTMSRVSAERLLSGPGLELIYQALTRTSRPGAELHLSAAEIVRRALQRRDSVCSETVDCFCGMLGTMASDLALTLGATGGIFVGGGIVPRLGERFDRSPFRARFEAKGRFCDYVARIPTYVLTAENLAFHGVSSLLADHMPDQDGGNPLLDRVRDSRESLSPAERRVANFVLDNPRTALNDPIAADRAGRRSEPADGDPLLPLARLRGPGRLQAQAGLGPDRHAPRAAHPGAPPGQHRRPVRQGARQHHLGDHAVPRVSSTSRRSTERSSCCARPSASSSTRWATRRWWRWMRSTSCSASASRSVAHTDAPCWRWPPNCSARRTSRCSSPARASRRSWRAPPGWPSSAAPR